MSYQIFARVVGCYLEAQLLSENAKVVAGIPACDEEKTIARVVIGALSYVDKVIVVDDGSRDMTGEIARRLGAEVIHHSANLGKGAALRTIFKRAQQLNADILVTLDSDGQHLPGEIPKVLSPIMDDGVDVSVGSRFMGESHDMPSYRKFGTKMIHGVVSSISGLPIEDTESGFRAYGRRAIASLLPSEMGMGADSELLIKAKELNLSVAEVSVCISYKGLKTSKHNPIYHGLDVLASIFKHLSIRHPLMFYGVPGAVFLSAGIIFGVWTFVRYLEYGVFPSLLGMVAVGGFSVGITLISIGVMLFTMISVLKERG